MADWTETYRPTTLAEVRGNDKARKALHQWAKSWDDHRQAVIVHGSPGVGKTSAAHALANDMGWPTIELNASDQRTKADIEQYAGGAAMNRSLSGTGRQLIILDEADNIHGNADRGGSGAITKLVKEAEQPMVLIANEFYDMSNGLRNACEDIEFRDVSVRSIVPVLRDICRKEDLQYEPDALDAIAEANSGDLRGAVKDLQATAEGREKVRKEDVTAGGRDKTEGIFQLLDAVFKEEDAEGALKFSYDVDETPDDMVNWIEDNLPKDYHGTELADAYGFLANADRWLGRVRATQNYSYWRYASDNMTAGVAAARSGQKGGWTRYGPPSYWRKLGSSRASRDKRDYVARHIAETGGMSMASARKQVLPYLEVMTHHCKNRELTVRMAAAYELEAKHVAFVTGSGEDTNKVQSIVEDAQQLREEAAVEHSDGAFAGGEFDDEDAEAELDEATNDDANATDTESEDPDGEESGDQQSGLADFY
ncbi:replication factor C large subunit [Halomarina oriensis]|uniref:Replication factor C large subunit n=1 Tax=Halomarina oriensis TaxID=671145 RepID=A0A6B0GH87_9EURY|nr:replication factor C large subunit [Halomarina oriensis]MWG34216.1 replication factor C large subunit [Halomarina oriensis]